MCGNIVGHASGCICERAAGIMPATGVVRKVVEEPSMPSRSHVLFFFLLIALTTFWQPGRATDVKVSAAQAESTASPSTTVLRATTRLVVVDVVATDSKGEPVPDLKAEDFTVLEDGKPQKISGFSFQRGDAAKVVEGGASAGTFSNAPRFKNVNSMNVILLDALNGNFAGRASKGDGVQFATLSCAVAAFSETGSLVKEEITNLTANMKVEDFERMMKGQMFPCKRTIDLKPGSYNLAIGVVDRTSRLMGTTTAWVRVP